jgi:hypothetical protein
VRGTVEQDISTADRKRTERNFIFFIMTIRNLKKVNSTGCL